MTMNHTETMRKLRAYADTTTLTSAISGLVRELDIAERRATLQQRDGPRLARLILGLQKIKASLGRAREQADSDPRAKFVLSEVEVLDGEIGEKVKAYITSTGDHTVSTLGPTAWAKAVLRRENVEKAEAEKRRQARAARPKRSAPPAPTATKRGVRRTAKSRAGRCPECRRQVDYLTTAGYCNDCVDKVYPRIARRRR